MRTRFELFNVWDIILNYEFSNSFLNDFKFQNFFFWALQIFMFLCKFLCTWFSVIFHVVFLLWIRVCL